MRKKHLSFLFLLLLTITGGACSHGSAGSGATDVDSVPQPLLPLPDTALASVDALDFAIDTLDTLHNGRLDGLRDTYRDAPGFFTFRANLHRDADYNGKVTGRPTRIVQDWRFVTEVDNGKTNHGSWGGGMGWTGQPLYVNWPDSVISRFKRENAALTPDFAAEEIIAASLYGDVYFINFNTGRASRAPLPAGNPVKGTPMLDPTLNGNLYVGQGIMRERPWGQTISNIFSRQRIFTGDLNPKAWRHWGGNDSSPVKVGQYVFWPSEDGTLYKYFIAADGTATLHSTLRYHVKGAGAPGIEASLAVHRNYGYLGDNHGNVICVELNTLRPVWRYSNGDDIDASPVIEMDGDTPMVYIAGEVDRQGMSGICHITKINGLTGEPKWQHSIKCARQILNDKHFDGGVYGTPLLGHGNCDGRVFMNVCQIDGGEHAHFIALDTRTGKELYRVPLKYFAWNSPVAFFNERNEMFIFTGDSLGNAYLIDGATGEVLFSKQLADNFESSAVVVGNSLVIGSRGNSIYRFSII